MAGKRLTLTDDESLTLKRVLEFQVDELQTARQSNKIQPIQRHALDLSVEKIGRLYAKIFPEAISKNKNP